jgi:uncharacterized protein (TIGR03086 family)
VKTTELFNRSVEEFDRRVRLIQNDQWERSTPCSEWTVRDLVNHVVNEDRWTTPLMEGKTIADVGDALDGDLLGNDPVGAWESASAEAIAAINAPGALERTVHVSFGDITGDAYANQLFSDHLIHAWDLARGIGDVDKLDAELVEVCYTQLKPMEEALKASGAYGTKVEAPESADTQTKLLAVVGRQA